MLKPGELKDAITKSKRCIWYAAFFSCFVNILMLTPPMYMLQLYDRVVTSRSLSTLFFLTLIVMILFVMMGIFEVLRSRILIVFATQLDKTLSERVYDAIFKLSSRHPGRVSSQAMSDLNAIKQYMSTNGIFAFLDAPWLPIYILILFLFHPAYGWFALASAIVLFGIALLNENATKNGLKKSNESNRAAMRLIDMNLRNTEVINAMGMNEALKKNWKERHKAFLDSHALSSAEAGLYSNISKTMRVMSQSLMLGLGAYLVVMMEVTPGMMIAGSIIMGRALAPLDLLIASWKQYKNTRESYERLDKFLADFPVERDKLSLPNPQGAIACETVTLVPPGAKAPSLMGVSFELKAGDMCALIGPSAAGKSSLARAVLGIWPLAHGVVRIDGADINQYYSDALGQHVGYVPQDVELFEGTVAENIARFGEIDSEAIVEAAKKANVHEMILRLPDGYDTKLGAGGMSLSGGQRQRVALARALYKNPKIIVLDEPNASLDEEGEKALYSSLLEIKGKATIILITHKLNVLQAVDKIAVLQAGKLVYFGARDAVLEQLGVIKPAAIANQEQAKQG
ncbi:type I secretion system permease/ATPase [Campylobacter magnus]|uniref:type I secretion system permease/ATPase n=1 Tax=Campylobacter magnus TaxID=3026462 RepID=UPI0026E0B596|nr:type I secretion system permease/ATPase [Campylobacter magnus]MDO2408145.1 type I secretion system permease/ATPase [Campylobacter magnus]